MSDLEVEPLDPPATPKELGMTDDGYMFMHRKNGGGTLKVIGDSELGRKLQAKRTETTRAKRARTKAVREERALAVIGPAIEGAMLADASSALERKDIEELGDLIVRRMAKLVLLGGDAYIPLSLKDCTEAAKGWQAISSMRRKSLPAGAVVDDDPAAELGEALTILKDQMRKRQAG